MTAGTEAFAAPPGRSRSGRGRLTAPVVVLLAAIGIAGAFGALAGQSTVLGVAAAGALLMAVAMAIRPDVAVFVVVGVIYSNAAVIAVQFHNVPAFAAVAVPILLLVPVGYELLVKRQPVVITAAFPLMIVFLLVQIIGTIFADNVPSAFDELTTFVVEGLGLYFLLVNSIRSETTLRWVVWILLAVGAFLGFLSFYQDSTHSYSNNYGGFAQLSNAVIDGGASDTSTDDQLRLAGPIGEKNRYAQIMLMLVPLGLFWGLSARRRWTRIAGFVAAAAASVGVALTFSRGAAVGFAIVLIVMIAMGYIKTIQVVLVGLAMAVLLIAVPTYANRLGSLVDIASTVSGDTSAGTPDGAVLSRATEGIAALLVFADHPLVGVGPGRFPSYYRLYADDVGIRVLNSDRQAHNLYLHIAAENGILGLTAFLAILGVTLRDLIRVRRRWLVERPAMAAMATGLFLAVVTYMTTGIFLHLSYARYLWLIMALAGAAGYIGLRLSAPARAEAPALDTAEGAAADRPAGDRPSRAPSPVPAS